MKVGLGLNAAFKFRAMFFVLWLATLICSEMLHTTTAISQYGTLHERTTNLNIMKDLRKQLANSIQFFGR